MKIVRIILLLSALFLACTPRLQAQNTLLTTSDLSNVNMDSYSDDQIATMLKKASDAGVQQSQLFTILTNKGLPASELNKLKARISRMKNYGMAGTNPSGADTTLQSSLFQPHPYDSTNNYIPVQTFKPDETIFGSELFAENSLVFEPNLNIPTPEGYTLGPGDELIISVYGYSEQKYDLRVMVDGEVYIPQVGPIMVSGLSIRQATEKIRTRLASTIYRAIATGKTQVQVTLGKIRSIRVTVIGQAKKPGTFTVSSLSTLFNVLYLCGGPTPMGSYRDIQLIRDNQIRDTADLYHFLVDGDEKDNLTLKDGDIIRIPYFNTRVKITGNVKREGKFEMIPGETFSDLLKYCGGFTDTAYRGAVTVVRLSDTGKKVIDLSSAQYSQFHPQGSDEFVVNRLEDDFANRVLIDGSVNRPGQYQLKSHMTVADLLDNAGGLKRDAYPHSATLFRYIHGRTPATVPVNLDSVRQFGLKIYLQNEDSLYIHSNAEFSDKSYVIIEGNVRRPGQVDWRENYTLGDLLLASGGITGSGDSSNIEILRRIRHVNYNVAQHEETQVITVDLSQGNQTADQIPLNPYDMVIIKPIPGYIPQRSVLVEGEVKSPGRYGLENSEARISDIIAETGGLKFSADSSSITIRRPNNSNLTKQEKENLFQRVLDINPDSLAQNPRLKDEVYKTYDLISVDLRRALADPSSPENLPLEDGDILTVNRKSNLVKISGEVYFPTIVAFKPGENLKYYVEQAGNFTAYARKSGALVIYPDGKVASVRHFLFFRSYPDVTARSEIYVPQKAKVTRSKMSVGEFALLVSSLGVIINVLKL